MVALTILDKAGVAERMVVHNSALKRSGQLMPMKTFGKQSDLKKKLRRRKVMPFSAEVKVNEPSLRGPC